jgi:riboflavin transporter FmnP
MLYVVSLAAVSIVLGFIEIPWPIVTGPFSPFVKLDFSEIAILIAIYVLGTKEAFLVVLVRTLARRIYKGFEPADLVGELLAMTASFALILGFHIIRKLLGNKEKPIIYEVSVNGTKIKPKEWIISLIINMTLLPVFMIIINYFIGTPLYLSLFGLSESGAFHPTIFTFIKDAKVYSMFGYNVQFNLTNFFWFVVVSYTPFNMVKAALVTVLFLLIKPRMKYLEL